MLIYLTIAGPAAQWKKGKSRRAGGVNNVHPTPRPLPQHHKQMMFTIHKQTEETFKVKLAQSSGRFFKRKRNVKTAPPLLGAVL